MTLGAFLLGMLLSISDFRYQIEATIAPFKQTLMGLFFITVGMSIDVGALLRDGAALLIHVPVVLILKSSVLIGLVFAFGVGRCRFAELRGTHPGNAGGCGQHDYDSADGKSRRSSGQSFSGPTCERESRTGRRSGSACGHHRIR